MPQLGSSTKRCEGLRGAAMGATMKALLALVAALAIPAPTLAVEPAAVASQIELSPHERILVAMEAGVDFEEQISSVIDTMAKQLVTATPELLELEGQFPGLSRKAAEAMRPTFRSYSTRVRELYRPRFIAVFAEMFTPAEAEDVADFYASPVGRRLLGAVSDAYDGSEIVAAAVKGGDISDAAIMSDTSRAARRAVARMSEDELTAMGELAQRKPALLKLATLNERLRPFRVEMENAPMLPEEEKALEYAITTAMEKHVARGVKGK